MMSTAPCEPVAGSTIVSKVNFTASASNLRAVVERHVVPQLQSVTDLLSGAIVQDLARPGILLVVRVDRDELVEHLDDHLLLVTRLGHARVESDVGGAVVGKDDREVVGLGEGQCRSEAQGQRGGPYQLAHAVPLYFLGWSFGRPFLMPGRTGQAAGATHLPPSFENLQILRLPQDCDVGERIARDENNVGELARTADDPRRFPGCRRRSRLPRTIASSGE